MMEGGRQGYSTASLNFIRLQTSHADISTVESLVSAHSGNPQLHVPQSSHINNKSYFLFIHNIIFFNNSQFTIHENWSLRTLAIL